MTPNEIAIVIRRWFTEADCGGLVLPDGWFGRPYDSYYFLEKVEQRNECLVVCLNEERTLICEKPCRAKIENSELVVDGFSNLVLQWRESKGTQIHQRQYDSGEMRFIPPVGTTIV